MEKKPVQKRGQSKVDLIVQSAIDLFVKDGIEKTTTNHIAKHAGIPIGSLYQFFKDKAAIVDYLVNDYEKEVGFLFSQPKQYTDLGGCITDLIEELLKFKHEKRYCGPLFKNDEVRERLTLGLAFATEPLLRAFKPYWSESLIEQKTSVLVRVLLSLFAIESSHPALSGEAFFREIVNIAFAILTD